MKMFSVLSLVVALFAASTVVGQDGQASPSDAPAVQVQPQASTDGGVVQAAEGSVVMPAEGQVVPMEGQIVTGSPAPMASNVVMGGNCCGSVQPMMAYQPMQSVVSQPLVSQPVANQPCCGQTAAPMVSTGCNGCATAAPVYRVRRPIFRRTRTRGCCN